MTIRTKKKIVTALKVLNGMGIIVLIVLTLSILQRISEQAKDNHDDNLRAVAQIKDDHDMQNRYLECLVNLFLEESEDIVTQEQSAVCLKKTREIASKTSTIPPTPSNGQTTTTTTTTQSKRAPAETQVRPTITTSEPPDKNQPTPKEPAQVMGVKLCVPLTDKCVR